MTTLAQALGSPAADLCILVRIEGLGDASAWTFCSQVPDYAAGDDNYKEWLEDFPRSVSESVDPLGGFLESGELEVRIQDHKDLLTGQFRFSENSVTTTSTTMTAVSTSVTVNDASGISNPSTIWIENEALRVTGVAGSVLTVTRSLLDTDAKGHPTGAHVYQTLPFVRGRRVRFLMVNKGATVSTEELELGAFYIDEVELSDDLNAYVMRGKSGLKALGRDLPPHAPTLAFFQGFFTDNGFRLDQVSNNGAPTVAYRSIWPGNIVFFQIGEEIFKVDSNAGLKYVERGLAATQTTDDSPAIGTKARVVMFADKTQGSFRWSPGPTPSTSRSSGTWNASAHFVDILLCILTSSAIPGDGFELQNYDTNGNWSSLPQGFGLAIPIASIDVASFLDVKARTGGYEFPWFIYGWESEPAMALIQRSFLKPLGCYITTIGGQLKLVLPRIPLVGSSTTTVGDADLVEPPTARYDTKNALTTIKIKSKMPNGASAENIFRAQDFQGLSTGLGGVWASEEPSLELEVYGLAADASGLSELMHRIAERRLFRMARPYWILNIRTGLHLYQNGPGDLMALSHGELPDMQAGTRGWTDVPVEITGKVARLEADFAGYEWAIIGYGPNSTKVGRVSPAARIISIAGTGPYVCTVYANRYTDPNATGGLPTSDAAAFTIGDVLMLCFTSGLRQGVGTQAITALGTNTITIDGNFGGALVATRILQYALASECTQTQQDRFVFFADKTANDIQTGVDPWIYGEP